MFELSWNQSTRMTVAKLDMEGEGRGEDTDLYEQLSWLGDEFERESGRQ